MTTNVGLAYLAGKINGRRIPEKTCKVGGGLARQDTVPSTVGVPQPKCASTTAPEVAFNVSRQSPGIGRRLCTNAKPSLEGMGIKVTVSAFVTIQPNSGVGSSITKLRV